MGLLRRLIRGEVPGDLGFIAQRMVIVMGQEEGCGRTVSTPPLSTCRPYRSCRGRCLVHMPRAGGHRPLGYRGLGPGSALLPGGEPHVLEGWWEKESTPSCLHLAVNPRKSPHTAPGGGEDCVSLTHPRWGQEVGVPLLSSSVYRKMERLAHQRKQSLHPGSSLL